MAWHLPRTPGRVANMKNLNRAIVHDPVENLVAVPPDDLDADHRVVCALRCLRVLRNEPSAGVNSAQDVRGAAWALAAGARASSASARRERRAAPPCQRTSRSR